MSALNHLFELQDAICYVQCGYCTTILLVSVPCSSLCNKIVTVRCGHCTSLLSVNLMKTSLLPLHLFASFNQIEQPKPEVDKEEIDDANKKSADTESPVMGSSDEDLEDIPVYQVVNKPPEKRQRAPSAYNCFIKEEIKRLKTLYPNMTHKQAFSTAAKNFGFDFSGPTFPQVNIVEIEKAVAWATEKWQRFLLQETLRSQEIAMVFLKERLRIR